VNPETIVKLVALLGVVLLVVAIGIRARLEDLRLLLRQPALALRAMVTMYVALPAFVLVVAWFAPLQTGVGAVLLGFAVSPVLPPWAKKGVAIGGRADYVIGLQVLSSGVALLVVPLMIWIVYRVFGVETALEPLAVELVLLVTVAVPLALGMGLARLYPSAGPRLAALADRAGGVILLLGAVGLLIVHGRAMVGAIGQGTLVAIVAVVAFGLLVGHLLGGPDPGNRGALASATVLRHPAIALLLASAAFPEHESTIIGTVLLYMLASLLITVPYERWRKSVTSDKPHVAKTE
jgi:bile acid:Na+ symporter, BASS family